MSALLLPGKADDLRPLSKGETVAPTADEGYGFLGRTTPILEGKGNKVPA